MMADQFSGRLGLQQRVLPSYRALFLDTLAGAFQAGLQVFAGRPLSGEGIESVDRLNHTQIVWARNYLFGSPGSPGFLCWQAGFTAWLEKWQPQLLIVEANPRYLSTRRAIEWMHRQGRKVIGWGLGAPPIDGALVKLREKERLSFLRKLDGLIAYSKLGAEQYLSLGIPPERVFTAFNAVAAAPRLPLPERPLGFTGKPKILFIGRLQERKRVDLLLQACAALSLALQPEVFIVGDGPVRSELEKLSRQVYPQVIFTGEKHGAELEQYFNIADLFTLPGTGGLAIQQAMAHGLPVIVARGDGTQDDLVRDENGWQVQPDNLTALTNTLREALSDPARLRAMGNASFCIARDEINVEKMAEAFVHAINTVQNH